MKLGRGQLGVLCSLRDFKSWNARGAGWVWSTPSGTERILDSLVKKGLATKSIETLGLVGRTAMVWRPTEAGLALVGPGRNR